jgi:type-F conjugative transfer system pilin assembly protein TrbC
MNSLSIETKKFKMSMKDVPLKQSSKKCHAQQGPRIRPDKCSTNLPFPGSESSGSQKTSAKFLIFVSTSMPQQSIKTLGQEAHKIGAKIIFRGLIGGTFKETQNYMQSLGVTAEIDPTKFEDYKIVQVPTFILEHNKVRDHVAGHVSIWAALEQFKNRGELKAEAQKLYNQLKQHLGQGVHS